jgi:hypothetical protein
MKLDSYATPETSSTIGVQIAVIDTRLQGYEQIVAALSLTMQVVLIDGRTDGLAAIAAAVGQFPEISALHLFSHASPGSLQLGSSYLNASTITTAQAQSNLQRIGSTLVEDGIILVYGCDLAQGETGLAFISQLASLSGVTVAASSNTTGAIALRGDWTLEAVANQDGQFISHHSGMNEALQSIASQLSQYEQVFAGLVTASEEIAITTGNDYINSPAGVVPMAILGATELSNGTRVVLQANNHADYYGMANLDYLKVSLITSAGSLSEISLSGTVANVINNNAGVTHNGNSVQTKDAASIVALKNGGFVVSSYSDDGYGVQMYNNTGTSLSITAPATYTSSINPSAKVLASSDGGFVLLWTVNDTALNSNAVTVSYQRYNASGVASGATISETFATTIPVVQNAAIDSLGNIAVPISANDVFTHSQVILWSPANTKVGIFDTAYYQTAAVIAPMFGGGFDLFGNDVASGVGNTSSSYWTQALDTDGSFNTPIANVIPIANLNSIQLSLSGDYLAVGGATDTDKLGYVVDGFNPAAGSTSQVIADASKIANTPDVAFNGQVTSGWITNAVTNANGLVTSGSVSVVTYNTFTAPADYPPTLGGDFTETGTVNDNATITPFANLTVSDIDSSVGKVLITYDAANGSFTGSGLSGVPGNYVLETTTASLATLNSELRALVFVPTANQVPLTNTVQTRFTITPSDGTRDGRANTATVVTATSVNDLPMITGLSAADNQSIPAISSAVLIDIGTAASVTDADTANFNLGSLRVSFGSGRQSGDVLAIRTGSGVTLSNNMVAGSSITIDGQVIGSIANGGTGAGSDNLIVNFNAQATPARVSTLLQNLNFDATSVQGDRLLNIIVNDGTDNSTVASVTLSVITNPTVAISSNAGPLKAGDTASITFTFSQTPIGFTESDISVSGGSISNLTVDGGNDKIYTATFTPTAATQSVSGSVSIAANMFTNNTAEPNLASTINPTLTGDTLAPSVSSIVRTGSTPSNATSVNFTVTFAESVSGVGTSDFSLTPTGNTTGNIAAVSGSGTSYTVTVNGLAGEGTLRLDLNASATGIVDTLGNPIAGGFTAGQIYTFDRTAPVVNTITRAQSDNTNASSLTFDVVFSESISNLDTSDFVLSKTGSANGTVSAVTGSGSTYTVTVNGVTGAGTLRLDLNSSATGIIDGVTNAIASGYTAGQTYTIDRVAPSVSSIVPAGAATTNGASSSYTVTFSENVTDVDIGDFVVTGTNTATANIASISGSGNVYTVTVDTIAGDGSLRLDLKSSGTAITDTFGNTISAGYTSGTVITVDRIAPTLAVPIAISDSALKIGDTSTVTFTFSEAITGLTTDDLTVENGTISNLTTSNGGSIWTATLTPTNSVTDSANILSLNMAGIVDLAGNAGSGTANSGNYEVDTVRPVLASAITVSDNALKIGESATVSFIFNEAITGFTIADITSPNGVLSNLSTSDSGITWSATLTPNASTTSTSNVLTLDNTGVTDLAGNTGAGTATSPSYAVDTVRPTLASAMTISDAALKIGDTAVVGFVFSEAVTNFTSADVTTENATLSNPVSSDGGITWTANLTALASITDSLNNLTLNLATINDLAGNAGVGGATSGNYSIDTVRPGVSSNMSFSDSALKIGETSTMTISFTEAVVNLDASDFTVSNGSLNNFISSNGGTIWTATLTPNANVNAASNTITLNHAGFNDLAGNVGSGTSISPNFAIDTLRPSATITLSDSNLGLSDTAVVTITFNEPVSGFTNADISLPVTSPLGSLSPVVSNDGGKTWTATFTPPFGIFDGSNLISVDTAGVSDLAGNVGLGINSSANFIIDTVNTVPSIGGAVAAQVTSNLARILPFANITVSDPDPGAMETATISLDDAAKGSFTPNSLALSGFYTNNGGLSYLHDAVTPAAMQAAIRALVFEPNPTRLAVNTTETTVLNIVVRDEHLGTASNNTTSIITSAVNVAPSNILISDSSVSQSDGANATVGLLSAVDSNLGDSHVFSLGAVNASNDNAKFTIVGNSLKVINPASMTEKDYYVTVQATDTNGLSFFKQLTISLDDDIAPYITSIETLRSPRPTITTGSYIVKFNENVTGVSIDDFFLTSSDGTTAHLSSITALTGNAYRVYIDQIVGTGSLNLNLKTNGTGIADLFGNSLPSMSKFAEQQSPSISISNIAANETATSNASLIGIQHFQDFLVM